MSKHLAVSTLGKLAVRKVVNACRRYVVANHRTAKVVARKQDAAEKNVTLSLAPLYRVAAQQDNARMFGDLSKLIRFTFKRTGGNVGTASKIASQLRSLSTARKGSRAAEAFAAYCDGQYPVGLQKAYSRKPKGNGGGDVPQYGREVTDAFKAFAKTCKAHKLDPRKVANVLAK